MKKLLSVLFLSAIFISNANATMDDFLFPKKAKCYKQLYKYLVEVAKKSPEKYRAKQTLTFLLKQEGLNACAITYYLKEFDK